MDRFLNRKKRRKAEKGGRLLTPFFRAVLLAGKSYIPDRKTHVHSKGKMLHCAGWSRSAMGAGKRVAVIGRRHAGLPFKKIAEIELAFKAQGFRDGGDGQRGSRQLFDSAFRFLADEKLYRGNPHPLPEQAGEVGRMITGCFGHLCYGDGLVQMGFCKPDRPV